MGWRQHIVTSGGRAILFPANQAGYNSMIVTSEQQGTSLCWRGSHTHERGRAPMADLLAVGTPAPDFTLPATGGQMVSLRELVGRKHVVLVFYVGDNTPD